VLDGDELSGDKKEQKGDEERKRKMRNGQAE